MCVCSLSVYLSAVTVGDELIERDGSACCNSRLQGKGPNKNVCQVVKVLIQRNAIRRPGIMRLALFEIHSAAFCLRRLNRQLLQIVD